MEKVIFTLKPTLDFDKTLQGFQLLRDSEEAQGKFTVDIIKYTDENGNFDPTLEPIVRAGQEGGQRHAEALLREQVKIPKEWREKELVFADTVWAKRFDKGNQCFTPHLRWDGNRWRLYFPEFFYPDFLFAIVIRKVTAPQ